MLEFIGRADRSCDGISRRRFLKVGALAIGGLTLPHLLRARAEQPSLANRKSVILIWLAGGPSHIDMYDLKPDAPAEVKGEFKPIDTNVPGIRIGELLPKLSRCADRYLLLRSITGLADEHSSFQNMTGFGMNQTQREGKPHAGAVIARTLGQRDPAVPAFLDLFPTMQHKPYNSPGPGFLGRAATPVKLDGGDLDSMKLQA